MLLLLVLMDQCVCVCVFLLLQTEQQALIKATSSFMCNELMNDCIRQECLEIAQAVLTDALDNSRVKEELSQSVTTEVLDSGVSQELFLITREVYRLAKLYDTDTLRSVVNKV